VIITKQFIEEVNRLVGKIPLVFRCNEPRPRLSRISAQEFIVLRIKPNVIFVNVSVQLIGSEDLCDFDQLIVVIVSVEKTVLS